MDKRDYYEILGVSKTATKDELKKAYRTKTLEIRTPKRNSKRPPKHTMCLATMTNVPVTTSSDTIWARKGLAAELVVSIQVEECPWKTFSLSSATYLAEALEDSAGLPEDVQGRNANAGAVTCA